MKHDNKKILVGRIVAPQGIRGEFRVQSFAEKTEDFRTFNISCDKCESGCFHFVRVVPNTNVVIARIDGVNDRNGAELLRGIELFINRDDLPPVRDNEYYQSDLIGFSVFRDNELLGTVDGFQNFGAGDIIELNTGDLVSFLAADVDLNKQIIKVK